MLTFTTSPKAWKAMMMSTSDTDRATLVTYIVSGMICAAEPAKTKHRTGPQPKQQNNNRSSSKINTPDTARVMPYLELETRRTGLHVKGGHVLVLRMTSPHSTTRKGANFTVVTTGGQLDVQLLSIFQWHAVRKLGQRFTVLVERKALLIYHHAKKERFVSDEWKRLPGKVLPVPTISEECV